MRSERPSRRIYFSALAAAAYLGSFFSFFWLARLLMVMVKVVAYFLSHSFETYISMYDSFTYSTHVIGGLCVCLFLCVQFSIEQSIRIYIKRNPRKSNPSQHIFIFSGFRNFFLFSHLSYDISENCVRHASKTK